MNPLLSNHVGAVVPSRLRDKEGCTRPRESEGPGPEGEKGPLTFERAFFAERWAGYGPTQLSGGRVWPDG